MVETIYAELKQDPALIEKYFERAGIYTISIADKVVYVGKSHSLLHRIAEHIDATNQAFRHKYRILNQAREQGIPITFDVIYYAKTANPYIELLNVEAYYINKLKPPLNIQIPALNNPKKYTINKKAKVITLDEILQH